MTNGRRFRTRDKSLFREGIIISMAPRIAVKKKFKRFEPKVKQGPNLDVEIDLLAELCKQFNGAQSQTFDEFPLSRKTKTGLKKAGFNKPTDIQRDSIAFALRDEDVLGAAKTGSGKTLAFVIPVLEKLYKTKWSKHDGLGALIISPTRELALQIFEVFRIAGGSHDFSIGAVIGGKDLKFEEKRLIHCNIIVCTPGRILQHLENNSLSCDNLQILILDEADQILDLGFEKTVNAIVDYLPSERQTLLFSATQTKSVRDLARLSLKNPVYVSAHEYSEHSTPEALKQSYTVCNLEDKTNALWAFINDHPNQKILVFISSCKQVKYLHTAFCRMRPQSRIFALMSKMHQLKRISTYEAFSREESAVLFATDIAARGLDFPGIHWVVQLDCPQDCKSYIHRVGRTARYESGGQSLLVLLPSEEEGMINELKAKKIPISKIQPKTRNVQLKLAVQLSRDVALKESAQRAFVAYFKSVYLMKNKKIFDVHKLNKEDYAKSLGLIQAPRIRFLQAVEKKLNMAATAKATTTTSSRPLEEPTTAFHCSDESADELFNVKRVLLPDDLTNIPETEVFEEMKTRKKKLTKAAMAKKMFKQKIKLNTRKVFDEDGEVVSMKNPSGQSYSFDDDTDDDAVGGRLDIEKSKEILKEQAKIDKEVDRQKRRERQKQQRLKEKRKRKRESDEDSDEEEEEYEYEDEGDDTLPAKKIKMMEELALRLLS